MAWGLLTSLAGLAIILQLAKRTIPLTALAVALAAAGATHGVMASSQREEIVEFAGEIARRVPEGAPLAIVRPAEELAFYAARIPGGEVKPGRFMDQWLETPGTIYLILDRRSFDDLRARPGLRWELLAERKLWKGDFYVVVRRPTKGALT